MQVHWGLKLKGSEAKPPMNENQQKLMIDIVLKELNFEVKEGELLVDSTCGKQESIPLHSI